MKYYIEGVIFTLFQCEEIAAGKISFNLKTKVTSRFLR